MKRLLILLLALCLLVVSVPALSLDFQNAGDMNTIKNPPLTPPYSSCHF